MCPWRPALRLCEGIKAWILHCICHRWASGTRYWDRLHARIWGDEYFWKEGRGNGMGRGRRWTSMWPGRAWASLRGCLGWELWSECPSVRLNAQSLYPSPREGWLAWALSAAGTDSPLLETGAQFYSRSEFPSSALGPWELWRWERRAVNGFKIQHVSL